MSNSMTRAQQQKAQRMAKKAIKTFLNHASDSIKVTKLIFPKEPRKPLAGVKR
jgi:hypothetical protein